PNVAVNLDKFAKEGVSFTNFYANSFRTDRGLVSIISGYPAQPSTSIMKYPEKTESLPSIPRSLKKAGYDLQYYYGGDADFTNMRSYLVASGISNIISEKDFPMSERTGKWGAPDHNLFQRLIKDLKEEKQQQPFFKIVQTSSSHEPFEVPFHRLDNKILNAFAYADSCVGDFVERYKETPLWKNTLIVLVPDHLGAYPHPVETPLEGHTIPLVLIGGALKEPKQVDVYASQIDIAATLLYQLGLPHDDFTFSKNMLNPASPHFAYFTEPTLFGIATPENQLVYNCDAKAVQVDKGTQKGANLERGKAYLQKLYDDLAKR
ncbi:MAG TPA: LTA synthase family protein, partial [Bacteroides reticulotermitis]|nr:LTA synthase family protein [Bacteroides reticulotermitis]